MENKIIYPSEIDDLLWVPRSTQDEDDSIELQTYGSINNWEETNSKTFCETFRSSMWTSFTIHLAGVPLALLMISVLFFNINTTNVCFEQIHRGNTLPKSAMKWVLAGHVVGVCALAFWFQLTLMLLFTWNVFMTQHRKTLLIAVFQGLIYSIYKIIMYTQDVNFTHDHYRYTGNAVFLFGVIFTGYFASKKISACHSANKLKKLRVFTIITTQYFLGGIIAIIYRYLTIPWFIDEEDETLKAIIAIIACLPVLALNIINEKLALSSSQFVKTGRNFILISFTTGVYTLVFRIMQADVQNIAIFIAISLYRGTVQIFLASTKTLRRRVLNAIGRYVRCCRFLRRTSQQNEKEWDGIRLEDDLYIQLMLYQHSALTVSQAYQSLYKASNFYAETVDVFAEALIRVAIGSAINLVLHSLSLFINMHWHNSRLATVWSQEWRLHMNNVAIGGVMTVLFYTCILLTVFHNFQHDLVMRNCTVPY